MSPAAQLKEQDRVAALKAAAGKKHPMQGAKARMDRMFDGKHETIMTARLQEWRQLPFTSRARRYW